MTCAGNYCWVSFFVWAIVWLIVASGLLVTAWNKVICDVFKMKQIKHWQSLLLLLTLCALCAPSMYMRRHHSHHCHNMASDECPYNKK